jgi:precorrin-6B methylase 2
MYMPTSPEVVDAMLRMAKAGRRDVLYDLGSGDGRIVIAAVRDFRVRRATGIEIKPELIDEANANAQAANVTKRVRFLRQDLFESDFRDATVVTLFLLRRLNIRLIPKLLSDLEPGTRIVSHLFDMGSWRPERTQKIGDSTIYLWRIPAKNTPEYAAAMAAAKPAE